MRAPRHIFLVSLLVLSLGLLAGCPSREVAVVEPEQAKEAAKILPVDINRDLDILFVVDDSGSMADNQRRLTDNLPAFMQVLQNIEGGLPNVHIGVTSTDVGSAPFNISQCEGTGDNGRLLAQPMVTAAGIPCRPSGQGSCTPLDDRPTCPSDPSQMCTPPNGNWIVDFANEDGTRQRNYSESQGLEETFKCIASLGICGCGLEQPLEAMKRALDGTNTGNAGFVRDNAFLAVIMITDEDDCSMLPGSGLADPTQNSVEAELGPLASFRCTEFGIECEPDFLGFPARTNYGPKQNCKPRENSTLMPHPQEYIDFLRSLKPEPGFIFTAGIKGPAEPFATIERGGRPTLDAACKDPPTCTATTGPDNDCDASADPGVRLKYFFDGFPGRNTQTSICNTDLTQALTQIAEALARIIGTPCLEGPIRIGSDGWPLCTVEDVLSPGTENEERRLVRRCPEGGNPEASAPCWYVEIDTDQCGATDTQLAITVERGDTNLPLGTVSDIRCEVE